MRKIYFIKPITTFIKLSERQYENPSTIGTIKIIHIVQIEQLVQIRKFLVMHNYIYSVGVSIMKNVNFHSDLILS